MEKGGGTFLQEVMGEVQKFPVQNFKKIFYTGTREFDNVPTIYLSKMLFHNYSRPLSL